jgi:hypothetical protein
MERRPAAEPLLQQLPDDRSLVAFGVAGSEEQGQRSFAGQLDQLIQQLSLLRLIQLFAVPAPELLPAIRTMAEPLPELVRGADLSQPEVSAELLLLDPPRPDAVHQDSAPWGMARDRIEG